MNDDGGALGTGDVERVRVMGLWSDKRWSSLKMEYLYGPRPLWMENSRRLGSVSQYVGNWGKGCYCDGS